MNKRANAPAGGAQSLTELAYAHLEELIVTLKLKPGAAVSEGELSVLSGIGRTPIREALQRLAREKLVTILPRRGIVVTEINVGSQLKLLEVRRELERLIARTAARRATDSERERFSELARRFEKSAKANDDVTFMRTDREFNTLCSVRRGRHEPHALPLAPLLVHPLQAGGRHAGHRQAARRHRARHRGGRRGTRREGERQAARRHREIHSRHGRERRLDWQSIRSR